VSKKIKTEYPNKQITASANKAADRKYVCINHPARDAFVDIGGVYYCKDCYLNLRK